MYSFSSHSIVTGGAVAITPSSNKRFLFQGCVFTGNSVWGDQGKGAAISAIQASFLTIQGCEFNYNTATLTGGAIYLDQFAGVSMTDSTFKGNSADGYGGAMYTRSGSSLHIARVQAVGQKSSGEGGAFCFYSTTTMVLSSILVKLNVAAYGGGAFVHGCSSVTFEKVISLQCLSQCMIPSLSV
jgi:predicted outer membrane repeat protein